MHLAVGGETYTRTIGGPEYLYDCERRERRAVTHVQTLSSGPGSPTACRAFT